VEIDIMEHAGNDVDNFNSTLQTSAYHHSIGTQIGGTGRGKTSGQPREISPSRQYKITASNDAGHTVTGVIDFEVYASQELQYPDIKEAYAMGDQMMALPDVAVHDYCLQWCGPHIRWCDLFQGACLPSVALTGHQESLLDAFFWAIWQDSLGTRAGMAFVRVAPSIA